MVRLDLSAEAERPVSFASDMIKFYNFLDEYLVGYGICLGACIMLAGVLVFLHLQTWTKPDEQKKVLVIICIPPAIGLFSFVALQLNEDDDSSKTLFLLLDCLKDCLAGLGISMFMSLWLASMRSDTKKSSQQAFLRKIKGICVENCFPLTLILPRKIIANQYYPKFLKYCTWQFLPIRLVCFFLMIFLQLHDMYPIWLSWAFFLIMNVSVTLAFFTVFAFFRAFMLEFPQYMLVAWVFHFILISGFCFLQGGVLKVLVAMGVIKSNRIHDNLVAFEMVHFSLLQCLAFSPVLYSASQSSLQMKSTISIAQLKLDELEKSSPGPYSVSQSSPQMKNTKLAAIAQPELVELKKKSSGPYSVSQSAPQMKRTKLAAFAQPKLDELKRSSPSVSQSSPQMKSTKLAAIAQPELVELKKSPGPYSVSQSAPRMKRTKLAAIPQPKLDELKKSSPGPYSVSQSSPQRKNTKLAAMAQPDLVELKKSPGLYSVSHSSPQKKSHGSYRVSQSAPKMKSTKLAAIHNLSFPVKK